MLVIVMIAVFLILGYTLIKLYYIKNQICIIENEWISVKDKLPENDAVVITAWIEDDIGWHVFTCFYDGKKWALTHEDDKSHKTSEIRRKEDAKFMEKVQSKIKYWLPMPILPISWDTYNKHA
jgi:hypothetical protein